MGGTGGRTRILMIAIFGAGVLVAARHGWYALGQRDRLLTIGASQVWRQGSIPAPRGRILDRDGQPLAWSERRFELRLIGLPAPEAARRQFLAALAEALGPLPQPPHPDLVLRRELSPQEFARLEPLLSRHPNLLQVIPRWRRVVLDYAAVRRTVGEVALDDEGRMTGQSGWELAHERELRGADGIFIVMCDRLGNWLPDTWRELAPMRPGAEVRIPQSYKELSEAPGVEGKP